MGTLSRDRRTGHAGAIRPPSAATAAASPAASARGSAAGTPPGRRTASSRCSCPIFSALTLVICSSNRRARMSRQYRRTPSAVLAGSGTTDSSDTSGRSGSGTSCSSCSTQRTGSPVSASPLARMASWMARYAGVENLASEKRCQVSPSSIPGCCRATSSACRSMAATGSRGSGRLKDGRAGDGGKGATPGADPRTVS